jgi:hypothetical protein
VLGDDDLLSSLKAVRELLALECASCGSLCDELMEGLKGLD